MRFSIPLLFAGMLSVFLRQVIPLILGYFRPTWEVGVYAGALRTSLLLVVILDSFNALFAPLVAIAASLFLMVVNAVRLIEVRLILKIQPYSLDFLKPVAAAALSSFLLIMAGKCVLPNTNPCFN